MRVAILGPLEARRDGEVVPIGGRRVAALLARLAIDRGRLVTASALIDAVWEEELPADPAHALQTLVSRLRRALGPDALAQESGGYRLADGTVDAGEFERLAAEGAAALRAHDPARAATLLGDALALWRGPALAGLADEHRFAAAEAARLEDLRLSAQADRIAAGLAQGRGAELVPEIEALVAAHPLDERLAAHQLAALAAAGRPADALTAYERTRKRLDEELGAIPSAELQAAHGAVLRGETGEVPQDTLPHPRSSFVGRAREVAEVARLLGEHRLVTLVGPGGAGKTRLAIEAARARGGTVWLVELAAVTEPALVASAVRDALGLREIRLFDSGAPLPAQAREQLRSTLATREALLVLDNCEHLIEAAADLADDLLAGCPGVRILATSREPLAIAGERLLAVAPLGLPEADATAAEALTHPAVELLADRGAAASPGFAVDDANVAAVVEVCRRLDGLPLAIELAAARLRSLSVEQIAARLDDRFRLLTGGSRTALPRQRTLRAVIDWSWDLLGDDERRLAARLAVFPGGVTPESAAAVHGDDALDLLASLVDRSLLQVVDPGAPRYRMLETLREYGIERLEEAGELDAVRTAHARHFAALAEEADPHLRAPEQLEWLARLVAERDNLTAALRWLAASGDARRALRMALSMGWLWLVTGESDEAQEAMRMVAGVPGEADPADRLIVGWLAVGMGEYTLDEARGKLVEFLDALEATGFTETHPLGVAAAPLLATFGGDDERTARLFDRARAHPDPWVRASVPFSLAQKAENDGEIEASRPYLREALAGFRAAGDRWALAMTLLSWGRLRAVDGALDDASSALEEAGALLSALNQGREEAMLVVLLADVRARQGRFGEARELVDRGRHSTGAGTERELLLVATDLRLRLMAGEPTDDVRREMLALLERVENLGPERQHVRSAAHVGLAWIEIEHGEDASEHLATAYAAAVDSRDMPLISGVGVAVAAALAAAQPEAAAETLGAAAAIRGSDDPTARDVLALTGSLGEALGEHAFAAAYERGRTLERAAAVRRIDPGPVLDPARVGA